MIALAKTTTYQKERNKFLKHNPSRAEALIKTLKKFVQNPTYPSLNLEKLSGSEFWTIRIDRSPRIFFIWINKDTALLVDIGPHDKYRKY